jgi:hypothetical protein
LGSVTTPRRWNGAEPKYHRRDACVLVQELA